jgi:hypothetical protein
MKTAQINFEDLYDLFFAKTSASDASRILQGMRQGVVDPTAMLSLHRRNVSVEADEALRQSIISLLKFYSLVEIGLVVKLLPEPSYESFWLEITQNLSFAPLRSFYESYYRLILPQFLLARLEGRLHLYEERVEEKASQASSLFLSFVDVVSRVNNPDIQYFLRSCAVPEAVRFLMRILEDKERVMSHILEAPDEQDHGHRVLHGLSGFLSFCDDLDRLLYASRDLPLFQSAMWNYFGDLFQLSGEQLGAIMFEAVTQFLKWPDDDAGEEAREQIARYVRDATGLIERLTSGFYGLGMQAPLIELAPPLVEA